MKYSLKNYLLIFLSNLIVTCSMTQEIVELPVTQSSETLQWENGEQQYFSTVWNTEVVSNISKPTMEVFRPAPGTACGTAIVICPGGGMYGLSINSEGNDVASWLSKKGVTAFVLKYRLVPTKGDATMEIGKDGSQVPIKAKKVLPFATSDGLNAIEYIRNNAKKYNIDPEKVGIIGFSAGGAVTMGVTFHAERKNRPDFVAPIYPWMSIIPYESVPADAGPIFIVCASDDRAVRPSASVELYTAWDKAGKSSELHMYANGGHGFGMRTQNMPSDAWIERFGEWLSIQGFLK